MAQIRYVETGEFRAPQVGEWFRGLAGFPVQARFDFEHQEFQILERQIEPDEGCEPGERDMRYAK